MIQKTRSLKKISLSLFFPAYNEEGNIAETVRHAQKVVRTITDTYELIIINDGSKDKTGKVADSLARRNKHIRVIHHHPNQGYGAAVWAGIQAARYDYVFFTDADLQFDLRELKKLVSHVPNYDVVIGYRAKRQDPFFRLLNAKGWNLLNRFLFGLKVKDIDCAFKLFKRELLISLPIRSRGAMMSAELLIHLQRQGIKFKEVPVTHLPRTYGAPTGAHPRVILRAFKELFQSYRGELGNVTQRQLVKFVCVGMLNTLFDALIYFVLTRTTTLFADRLLVAKTLSFLTGSISSFILNRWWTFRKTSPVTLGEVARFYVTTGLALGINISSLFVFLRLFRFYDIPAVIGATATTFLWNFMLAKFWVFGSREGRRSRMRIFPLDFIALCALVITTMVGAFVWLGMDSVPPHWDMANHLRHGLIYTDIFENQILESRTLKELWHGIISFLGTYLYYPPLVYWLSVPFTILFGRTFMVSALSNSIYAVILAFTSYGIGKRLWNRTCGLLMAMVMLSYPFIASQFHEFQLDMPLAAMTLLSLWALLATERWQNWSRSLMFGVTVGLGMLTKWSFLGFIIVPVLYELIGALRTVFAQKTRGLESYRSLIIGLLMSAIGALLVAGPWYLAHLVSLRADFAVNVDTGTREGDPAVWSVASFRYYYDALLAAQLRIPLLIPFIIGLILTIRRREDLQRNGVILAFIVGGYFVMTLYNNKDYRFIEPILGGIALLTVYWVSRLAIPWRYMVISFFIILSLFHFVTVNWGQLLFPRALPQQTIMIPDLLVGKTRALLYSFSGYTSGSPRDEDWQHFSLLETIMEDSTRQGKNTPGRGRGVALYYRDNLWFNRENFTYFVAQARYPVDILDPPPAQYKCENIDYIIVTEESELYATLEQDFPYYYAYPFQAGAPRLSQPLCRLTLMRTTSLPNRVSVQLWKVTR